MTDITELSKAAEKYRLTLEAHRNNPRDYDAVTAWDEATSEFMNLVDNDELNIISGLLEALEKAQQRISELESPTFTFEVTAEPFTCPRCGTTTTHPEGWHYCHKREAE